eukprot:scaffold272649_cov25-Prasinocladus_malaysianus.AAC.1
MSGRNTSHRYDGLLPLLHWLWRICHPISRESCKRDMIKRKSGVYLMLDAADYLCLRQCRRDFHQGPCQETRKVIQLKL